MTGLEKPDIYHQKTFNQVSFPCSDVIQAVQVKCSGCMIKGKMIVTLVCTGLDLFNKLRVERWKENYPCEDLYYSMSCGGGPQATLLLGETNNYSGHVVRQRSWNLAGLTALILLWM